MQIMMLQGIDLLTNCHPLEGSLLCLTHYTTLKQHNYYCWNMQRYMSVVLYACVCVWSHIHLSFPINPINAQNMCKRRLDVTI